MLVVDQHLVVEVRAGGHPGIAQIPDNLALAHLHALRDAGGESQQMRVDRLITVGMTNPDVISVVSFAVGHLDGAIARCHDRGSDRSRPVDAQVGAYSV